LRHRFAIRWLRNGGDIYHLSLHLGHTSINTTEVYLGHLSAREQAAAQGRNITKVHLRLVAQTTFRMPTFADDRNKTGLKSSL
jgi:site-specific recombinase XerC